MFSTSDIYIARVVSEEGSLRSAAQVLFKSQSAISQAIKRLEQDVGFKLFDRSAYRLSLSPKGKDFLKQSETLLTYESRLRDYTEAIRKGQESTFHIGVWPLLQSDVLVPALEQLNTQFQETRINIQYIESLGALRLLVDHQVELAICPNSPELLENASVETVLLKHINIVNVIAPELLATKPVNTVLREQLMYWKRVILHDSASPRSYGLGVGLGGRQWVVNDQRLMLELITKGLAWGAMPEPVVSDLIERGELCVLDLPEFGSDLILDIVAARVQGGINGPFASAFWDAVVDAVP